MEWISVKDEIPVDIFEYVLAYDTIDGVVFARCCNCEFQDKEQFYFNVTHWMPLPEPPK